MTGPGIVVVVMMVVALETEAALLIAVVVNGYTGHTPPKVLSGPSSCSSALYIIYLDWRWSEVLFLEGCRVRRRIRTS